MSYLRAEDILPKDLLETIQQYVNGQTIYIPAKEKQIWGSSTDTKQILEARNSEIYQKYLHAVSTKQLAEEYALSEKSIQRIIRIQKDCANPIATRQVLDSMAAKEASGK